MTFCVLTEFEVVLHLRSFSNHHSLLLVALSEFDIVVCN